MTDGQTDGRTDRILIARPHLHSMQRGKNNKTQLLAVLLELAKCVLFQEINEVITNNQFGLLYLIFFLRNIESAFYEFTNYSN